MTVMAAFHNAIAVYINSSSADYLLKLVLCSYRIRIPHVFFFFFFNDPPPTEIYPLSLHDALPISPGRPYLTRHAARGPVAAVPLAQSGRHLDARWRRRSVQLRAPLLRLSRPQSRRSKLPQRSEEHTSELQSPCNLVCRLLLEKKKQ